MRTPGFTAEQSLSGRGGAFRGGGRSRARGVVPAIPFCGNCDEILDRCARNGYRPRALCAACVTGNCFSGEEHPPIVLNPPPPRHWF